MQLAQKLSRGNTIQYRYTIRRVTVPQDALKISPELIPIFSAARPRRPGLDILHSGPPGRPGEFASRLPEHAGRGEAWKRVRLRHRLHSRGAAQLQRIIRSAATWCWPQASQFGWISGSAGS